MSYFSDLLPVYVASMMGKDGTGKTRNFAMFFLPCILTAVSTMLISELIAKCAKNSAQVSSSQIIPFWNLNTLFLFEILMYSVMVLLKNEYINTYFIYNNTLTIILTNTLALILLLSTNPKVSDHLKTFSKKCQG